MKIVCAASVTEGKAAFRTLGDVVVLPEREFTREAVRDADALVIRSKVRVTPALLEGTGVAFVGTATAGADHIDLPYLDRRGVAWCAAPGCNANSVAEYVVSGLLCLAVRHGFSLKGRKVAIVGVGHVGRLVRDRVTALGMIPLLNDPPLYAATGDETLRPLHEILPQADVVTLHTPLVDDGPHPTRALAGGRFFQWLKPGAIFINACRGEVADTASLLAAMDRGVVKHAILDVFENEPACPPEALARADLVTPHIAGHSYEGKLNGTIQVYRELSHFLEVDPAWEPSVAGAPPAVVSAAPGAREEEILWDAVRRAYDIGVDDAALRAGADRPAADRGALFERLRGNYPLRHEFKRVPLALAGVAPTIATTLRALGFPVTDRA